MSCGGNATDSINAVQEPMTTSAGLRSLHNSTIEIDCELPLPAMELPTWQNAEKVTLDDARKKLSVVSTRPARTIVDIVKWLDERGVELADIHIKRPSLEEAFIELTGKSLRE